MRLPKKMLFVTDNALIQDFKASNDTEFVEQLFCRYVHLVFGVCLKYLKDRTESQLAVMDIFEKVIQKVSQIEGKEFKHWLYVLTKNHCLVIIRKKEGISTTSHDLFNQRVSDSLEDFWIDYHPVDFHKLEKTNNSALLAAIEKLPNPQKECLTRFYYKEKSYSNIAETLYISKQQVKSLIQQAKRNLKSQIEKNGRIEN